MPNFKPVLDFHIPTSNQDIVFMSPFPYWTVKMQTGIKCYGNKDSNSLTVTDSTSIKMIIRGKILMIMLNLY